MSVYDMVNSMNEDDSIFNDENGKMVECVNNQTTHRDTMEPMFGYRMSCKKEPGFTTYTTDVMEAAKYLV